MFHLRFIEDLMLLIFVIDETISTAMIYSINISPLIFLRHESLESYFFLLLFIWGKRPKKRNFRGVCS